VISFLELSEVVHIRAHVYRPTAVLTDWDQTFTEEIFPASDAVQAVTFANRGAIGVRIIPPSLW